MLRSAGGAGGADHEIRPAQGVEVRRVVGGVEDAVEQLAELLGRRRRIDVEHGVQGLGGRHVMGLGADAADPRRQVRHVLGRPAHAELLEAAQLRDLQVGVGHVALVVQEDVDLAVAFEPGDGVDGNTLHGLIPKSGLLQIEDRKMQIADLTLNLQLTFILTLHFSIFNLPSSSAATGCWPG